MEKPEVEVDQEVDDKSKEVTQSVSIEQQISERISVVLDADRTDDGDKEAVIGIKISF